MKALLLMIGKVWHGLVLLLALSAMAQAQDSSSPGPGFDGEDNPWFRDQPDSTKYALVITGAGASEEITERFRTWSFDLAGTLAAEYGYTAENIVLLIDDGSAADQAWQAAASSRREDIDQQMQSLQAQLQPGDQLSVFLIGHGSSTGGESKFNIVGPDITGADFAEWLDGFRQHDLVIVNTTSASYEFSRELSAPGRVVVSATRSRAERFDPVFMGFFIEALSGRAGDRDKNGRVSVLEAFIHAGLGVEGWYSEQGRLATEHAVLDDNGDGLFELEPGADKADGRLAEIAYFDVPGAASEKQSPQALELRAQMQDLERSIFILRGEKAAYLEADYWNRLEALLIDLARKTEAYNALP